MERTVDINEARSFLQAIYGESDNMCFQIFDDPGRNGNGVKPAYKYGDFDSLSSWLSNVNRDGAGVFFMVSRGDGHGRTSSNVIETNVVFVDLDGADPAPLSCCGIKPHVVVESSPGRYHAYWKIEDCPVNMFTPVQSALAKKFNGDPSVKDLPRVMRLPGFYHNKNLEDPFLTKVTCVRYHQPLQYDEFVMGVGLAVETPEPVVYKEIGDGDPIPDGMRNNTLKSMSGRLRNSGLSGGTLYEALKRENQTRCNPPLPDWKIRKLADWVLAKEGSKLTPSREREGSQIGEIISWRDLHEREYPQPKWVIRDLLPTGLTVLAGRPSVGKSWLVQNLSLSVATGVDALSVFGVNRGRCLTLALEDTHQRYQYRMRLMLGGQEPPDNALFTNSWTRLPAATGHIEQWLDKYPDTKMLVIDCLAKIRPRGGDRFGGVYDKDYADIEGLQKLSGKRDMAIVLVHHERKSGSGDDKGGDDLDRVSGSAGITGAADTIWLFSRKDRSEMKAVLQVTGRDISDKKYGLVWDESRGRWSCDAVNGSALHDVRMGLTEAFLGTSDPLSVKELAERIGSSVQAVRLIVTSMEHESIVSRVPGDLPRYIFSDSKTFE